MLKNKGEVVIMIYIFEVRLKCLSTKFRDIKNQSERCCSYNLISTIISGVWEFILQQITSSFKILDRKHKH